MKKKSKNATAEEQRRLQDILTRETNPAMVRWLSRATGMLPLGFAEIETLHNERDAVMEARTA